MKRDKAAFDVLGKIDSERLKRGWTEYQLAVNSDITQSTISTWKKRNLQPNIASVEKICSGLGISLSEFFRAEDTEERNLTAEQRHILDLWGRLSPRQRTTLAEMINSFIGNEPETGIWA